jgi:zinc transporter 2
MSDAAHLLSDLLGFIISIISIYISRKVVKNNMGYGYHRAEIIGALINIFLI